MMLLGAVTFLAAVVNGALGYGFSSITVPLALLFLSSRTLNPALVLVEVFLNLFVLWMNRASLGKVWPKVKWLLVGIAPAVIAGGRLLGSVDPVLLKLGTYAVLLPLLFLQVAGWRRPLKLEGVLGPVFGGGVGFLYSLTTISGPPLALLFNNEGFVKEEFRAALAVVRVFESAVTAATYLALGLIGSDSLALLKPIVPAVALGLPLGALLIGRMNADVFRRVCMSFDVAIVAFGLSKVLQQAGWVQGPAAYSVLWVSLLLDGILLYGFFSRRMVK